MSDGIPNQKVAHDGARAYVAGEPGVALNGLEGGLPLFAKVVAEEQKRADPEQCSAVGIAGERAEFEFGGSGGERGEVAHARDEVAESKSPVADPLKPAVDLFDRNVGNRDECPEFAADQVAAGDPAATPGQRRSEGSGPIQMARPNEVTREYEQPFIRDRQSDDA